MYGRYHSSAVSPEDPAPAPAEAPVDPLYSRAASPFIRTEAPTPAAFASPPSADRAPLSAWSAHKTQIQFAFGILAFLMILVGAVTVVEARADGSWKYAVALAPALPAGIVIWLFVRTLARLDEVRKRVQIQALGFAMASTALLTFAYGLFEGAGWPALNGTLIMPMMALLWGVGMIVISVRYRFRR